MLYFSLINKRDRKLNTLGKNKEEDDNPSVYCHVTDPFDGKTLFWFVVYIIPMESISLLYVFISLEQ